MPLDIVLAVVGQWTLGNAACKLLTYGYNIAVAFTIFLLTSMSVDRYQVRVKILYQFMVYKINEFSWL